MNLPDKHIYPDVVAQKEVWNCLKSSQNSERLSEFFNFFNVLKRVGWGTWIRTRTNGVRVRGSTVNLFPNAVGCRVRSWPETWDLRIGPTYRSVAPSNPTGRVFDKTRPTPTAKRQRIHGPLFMNPGLRCQAWMPAQRKFDRLRLCISGPLVPISRGTAPSARPRPLRRGQGARKLRAAHMVVNST